MPPRRKSDAIERHPTTGRREMQAPQIKEHLESKVNGHKKPWIQDQPIVVYGNFIIANGWDLLHNNIWVDKYENEQKWI
jgi:hypothetical protein